MSFRKGLYSPHSETNPLASVAFGLLFHREFREVDIKAFVDAVNSDLIRVVPGRKFLKGQTFEISNGVPRALDLEQISGVEYSKFNDAGEPIVTFKVNGAEARVLLSSYQSWQLAWEVVSPILETALSVLCGLNSQKALVSQYQDIYKVEKGVSGWKNVLFRENSKYLPSFIYECDDLWHSHSGWYDYLENRKLLTQLFLNFLDQQDEESSSVYSVLDMKFNHVLHLNEGENTPLEWKTVFRSIHDYNKMIFSNMLSDDECGAIGL